MQIKSHLGQLSVCYPLCPFAAQHRQTVGAKSCRSMLGSISGYWDTSPLTSRARWQFVVLQVMDTHVGQYFGWVSEPLIYHFRGLNGKCRVGYT